MTKDHPEALMVVTDAEAAPVMPVPGRQMLPVGGHQPGPVQSGEAKSNTSSPHSLTAALPSLAFLSRF